MNAMYSSSEEEHFESRMLEFRSGNGDPVAVWETHDPSYPAPRPINPLL
jgi:hypothetical protein